MQSKQLTTKIEQDVIQEVACTDQLLNQLKHTSNSISSNSTNDTQNSNDNTNNCNDNTCYPVQTDKYDDELAQRILQKEATTASNENEPEIHEYMQHVDYTMNPSVSIDKRVMSS